MLTAVLAPICDLF